MKIFVTGGSGFIGSAFIRYIIDKTSHKVLNYDLLTYSSNQDNLKDIKRSKKYKFLKGDICNKNRLKKTIFHFKPDYIINFAAESHVDRSIENPLKFINTNIVGVTILLETIYAYWKSVKFKKKNFRFLQVSTDEVYGDLGFNKKSANERNLLIPSSPYAASKASADLLVKAWYKTFKLPVLITASSNNYGPFQFPEKLIPHTILSAIYRKTIPIYGKGNQIRDWLHVNDNVRAIYIILLKGKTGEKYNIGGQNELTNLYLINKICKVLDGLSGNSLKNSYKKLIKFVEDRPGHDTRYSLNINKLKKIGWKSKINFDLGLQDTIKWYFENEKWYKKILSKNYKLKRIGKIR